MLKPFCRDCADSDGRCMHDRKMYCSGQRVAKRRKPKRKKR
jgi:hypothetical protein